jgi:hypothetical protein
VLTSNYPESKAAKLHAGQGCPINFPDGTLERGVHDLASHFSPTQHISIPSILTFQPLSPSAGQAFMLNQIGIGHPKLAFRVRLLHRT